MKLLTSRLTHPSRRTSSDTVSHQSVLTIAMQITKFILEVWHLTALNPAIAMSIALRRLPLAMIMQKMAGFLICFGKFAPFESTEIIYHIK